MFPMGKDDFEGLLPENFEDFRSVEYWDGFFRSRNQKSFEWYGEWKQLRPHMLPLVKGCKSVLVVGCGNSDLSADMCVHHSAATRINPPSYDARPVSACRLCW